MSATLEGPPTRKRYSMLALIFFTVVINYMDRSNVSIAASAMSKDLNFSTVQMGFIFSAFGWTYALLQIPGGLIVDVVKPRILYPFILIGWSAATLVQGMVSSLSALIGCRAAIGVFEAPSYPCNNKIVTSWFPESERASAIGIYTSGQFIGLAFMTPILVTIQNFYGWRGLFIISGLIGIVWAIIWYIFFRSPQDHKGANAAELKHIEDGGGIIDSSQEVEKIHKKFEWIDLKEAFIHRRLWGIYIGQFCIGTLAIFFLTWFPTYLVDYRGIDFLKSGFLASIPFLAAFSGVLLSGFTSDYLVRKGYGNSVARKVPVICGTLLSIVIIAANYTESNTMIIFFLTLAFFGNGFASIAWVFVSSMAPKELIGLVGGVFNFIGGLAGIITPIVIGYLVKDGDFEPALFYIGAVTVVGLLSYTFLVGKVERIVIKDRVV